MTKKKSYFGLRPKYPRYMALGFHVFKEQVFPRTKFRHLVWYRKLRKFEKAESFVKTFKQIKEKKVGHIIELTEKKILASPIQRRLKFNDKK